METYYTKNHEWIKIDKDQGSQDVGSKPSVTVGITNYAASQLGDIVFIKLPEQKEYKQGEVLGEIESVKAASDIFSPLSGKVLEVNLELQDNPELINSSSQDQGWIAKLETEMHPGEVEDLMDEEKYMNFIETLK